MIINFKDIVEKYNIDIKIVRDFFNELAEHYELFSEKKMEEESFEFQAANNKDYKQILDLGLSYTNDMVTVNASLVPYLLDNGCSINGLLDVGIRTLNVELIEAVIDSSKRDIHADRLEQIYMIGKYLKNQKLIDFVNINNPLFIKLVNVNNPLLSMELASIDDTSLIGLDLAIKNHDKLVLSLGIKNNDRKLMEDALKHIDKIDTLNEIPFNIPVDILEKIMDKGLEPKKALNILCKNTTESEEQISNKIKLLNIIFKHAPSISSLGEWYYTSLDELKLLKKYPSIEIIEYISNMSQDLRNNTHLMNEIGITKEELTKIHEQFIEELLSTQNNLLDKFSFLDCAMKRSVPIFELIAKQLSSAEKSLYNPDLRIYVKILIFCNFRDLVNYLHPIMICKNDKITEYLRAEGSNLTTVELITKYNKLVENYISTINGSKDLMNKKITNLLKGEVNFADLNDISEEENDTGFSIIELVTLSGNFDLLVNILKANEYNDNLSNQVMTILSNFPNLNEDKEEIKKLFESVLKNMNIDQVLNNGESLTDILINLDEYRDQILKKTKDPLFYFMKEDANLISLDPKLVHIAISNDDGLWSTGVWSLARLLSKKFSNIGFHLVNQEILEKGGEDFAKQFSGWIIPGAMDNYPKKEFSKKDYEPKSPIEKLYQRVLKVVDELSIPLLGMCAGAQHLTIYKGGSVAPVDKKYFSGKNQIDIVDGTMTHFLHLNKEQQENFLKTLELVKISLKGDTAHHFAAKTLKNLELGAVSLDGVPMAFISDDGKMFATQYHPEHRFNSQEPEDAPQIAWIINVIKIIIMHHEDKINGSNNLETYIKLVKDRLDDWFVEHLFDETASLGQDAIHQDAIHN